MPLKNRVTPEGEIIATPYRGLMMGNRGGAIHRPDRTLGVRRWASKQWIACVLEFKGRHRAVMQPNAYTELFFLDEATALAAGHRPCFECRRTDAERFAELWARTQGRTERARAPAMDEVLHAERLDPNRGKRIFRARRADLPNGAFIRYGRRDGEPRACLVIGANLLTWHPSGYTSLVMPAAVNEDVEVLTPPSIVAILSAGYRPMLHSSAAALLA
ncbi:MAG: hypothetical protein J2P50_02220 [Hyphomicrobiaceae bacterium]|nr:hypothetical protein [Hyphomicrobiaceae bacterium]